MIGTGPTLRQGDRAGAPEGTCTEFKRIHGILLEYCFHARHRETGHSNLGCFRTALRANLLSVGSKSISMLMRYQYSQNLRDRRERSTHGCCWVVVLVEVEDGDEPS